MIRETDAALCELASLPVNTANCTNYSWGLVQLPSWQEVEEKRKLRAGVKNILRSRVSHILIWKLPFHSIWRLKPLKKYVWLNLFPPPHPLLEGLWIWSVIKIPCEKQKRTTLPEISGYCWFCFSLLTSLGFPHHILSLLILLNMQESHPDAHPSWKTTVLLEQSREPGKTSKQWQSHWGSPGYPSLPWGRSGFCHQVGCLLLGVGI